MQLTVPAEENFAQAYCMKKCKYADLIQECQEAIWEMKYFSIEDGSRGFTNQTLRSCFKYLDLSNEEIRKAIDDIPKTALRTTYAIWLARSNNDVWNLGVGRETWSANSNAAGEGGSSGPKRLTHVCQAHQDYRGTRTEHQSNKQIAFKLKHFRIRLKKSKTSKYG